MAAVAHRRIETTPGDLQLQTGHAAGVPPNAVADPRVSPQPSHCQTNTYFVPALLHKSRRNK